MTRVSDEKLLIEFTEESSSMIARYFVEIHAGADVERWSRDILTLTLLTPISMVLLSFNKYAHRF